MINKKADLREDGVKVMIAIIVLVLFVFGVGKLYASYTQNTELESAKSTINVIEAKINAHPENTITNITIRCVNAKNLVLTAFDLTNPNRPDACFEQSCIYICKLNSFLSYQDDLSLKRDCESRKSFRKLSFDEIKIFIARGKKDN